MGNFKKVKLFKWFIIIAVVAMLYPVGCYVYWSMLAIGSSPKIVDEMEDSLRKLSSEALIKKMHSVDPFSPYPTFAINILVERKEKKAVPSLINLIKSGSKEKRHMAIWALSQINDPQAIKPLMDILNKGEQYSEYEKALAALSVMKHEDAFKYVIQWSGKPDAYRNGSVGMLEDFGKPECIPLLLDIRNKIKDSDPMPKLGRGLVDDAIKHIESLQKNK